MSPKTVLSRKSSSFCSCCLSTYVDVPIAMMTDELVALVVLVLVVAVLVSWVSRRRIALANCIGGGPSIRSKSISFLFDAKKCKLMMCCWCTDNICKNLWWGVSMHPPPIHYHHHLQKGNYSCIDKSRCFDFQDVDRNIFLGHAIMPWILLPILL